MRCVMSGELIKSASWLTASNMEQAMRIAEMLAKSTLVPKAYQRSEEHTSELQSH